MKIEELNKFLVDYPEWCVSIFMPTHRTGRDTEQDPIRFKNLIREAEQRLKDKGLRSPTVREMLNPAEALLLDSDFWNHQSDGLAVFITSDEIYTFRLPLSFNELVVIANRFHVKPLLPFFSFDGHFYILALSQKQLRLLEGTRYKVDEINVEDLPTSLGEALQFDQFEKHFQFHTSAPPTGEGERAGVFHGHDPSDEDKKKILRWFQRVDDELSKLLADEQSPLVMASVEYLHPLYREANSYQYLLDKAIIGNPDELKAEELHGKAWELVHPHIMKTLDKAIARYKKLSGTDKTTTDIREAVLAAHHGRVEALFVAIGEHIWGKSDPEGLNVDMREDPQPGDIDLLDLAAAHSIINRGMVFALEPDQVPDRSNLAAIFRY